MKCSIEGCAGEYEERQVVHTVNYHGQVTVIDHVPAEVCTVCSDILFKPETVRRIESTLRTVTRPAGMAFGDFGDPENDGREMHSLSSCTSPICGVCGLTVLKPTVTGYEFVSTPPPPMRGFD